MRADYENGFEWLSINWWTGRAKQIPTWEIRLAGSGTW